MRRLAQLFCTSFVILAGILLFSPGHAAAANHADLKVIENGQYLDGPVTIDGIQFNNQGLTPVHMSFDWNAQVSTAGTAGNCRGSISYHSYTGHTLDTPWYGGVTYNFTTQTGLVHQSADFDINLPSTNSGAYFGPGHGLRVDYTITCHATVGQAVSDTVSVIYTAQQNMPKIDTFTLNGRPSDIDAAIKMPNSGAYVGNLTLGWSVRDTAFCVPYMAESTPSYTVLHGWGWEDPQAPNDPNVQTSTTFTIHVPADQLAYGTAATINYAFACYNTEGRSFTRYVALHLSRLALGQEAGCSTEITDIVMVLDSSSSMDEQLPDGRTKNQASQQALTDFKNLMKSRSLPVRFGFVNFSGGADFSSVRFVGVSTSAPYGVYQPPDAAGGPSSNPNSGTCIACAIKAATSTFLQQYRNSTKLSNPKIVLLLTDGQVTVAWDGAQYGQFGEGLHGVPENLVQPYGPYPYVTAQNQAVNFATTLAQQYPNTTYFTVGLGTPAQVDQPFLQRIARITHPQDDSYSFVGTSYAALSNFYLTKLPQAVQVAQPFPISGTLFEDLNRNGVRDGGEPVINGTAPARTVTVQSYPFDGSNAVQIPVTSGGQYTTTVQCPSEFRINQSLPAGWDQTLPNPSPGYYQEYLSDTTVRDFGSARQAPVVQGVVFDDVNRNGSQDTGEVGIANEHILLANQDGTATGTEAVTNANGAYTITFPISLVWTNPYIIQQAGPPPGYEYGTPSTGAYPPTVYPAGTTTKNFADIAVIPPTEATLSGTVFNDVDANGTQGIGESGMIGIQITVRDATNNVVANGTTDNVGNYLITIVGRAAGVQYTITSSLQAGFTFTQPASGQYTNELLDPSTQTVRNFGMYIPSNGNTTYGPFCS